MIFKILFIQAHIWSYEIQVEEAYQQKGIGTMLLQTLEKLAKRWGPLLLFCYSYFSTEMEKVMATVFGFNHKSLGFFHKNDYTSDVSFEIEQFSYFRKKKVELISEMIFSLTLISVVSVKYWCWCQSMNITSYHNSLKTNLLTIIGSFILWNVKEFRCLVLTKTQAWTIWFSRNVSFDSSFHGISAVCNSSYITGTLLPLHILYQPVLIN